MTFLEAHPQQPLNHWGGAQRRVHCFWTNMYSVGLLLLLLFLLLPPPIVLFLLLLLLFFFFLCFIGRWQRTGEWKNRCITATNCYGVQIGMTYIPLSKQNKTNKQNYNLSINLVLLKNWKHKRRRISMMSITKFSLSLSYFWQDDLSSSSSFSSYFIYLWQLANNF